jgi:uncharacterized membrane protein
MQSSEGHVPYCSWLMYFRNISEVSLVDVASISSFSLQFCKFLSFFLSALDVYTLKIKDS